MGHCGLGDGIGWLKDGLHVLQKYTGTPPLEDGRKASESAIIRPRVDVVRHVLHYDGTRSLEAGSYPEVSGLLI